MEGLGKLGEQYPMQTFEHRFKFPDRDATGVIISVVHHGGIHYDHYILRQLLELNNIPDRTLFVEQGGSPRQADHILSRLAQIAQNNSAIAADFNKMKSSGKYTSFNQQPWTQDYGLAADVWLRAGGNVINMDLSANFSPDAIQFMTDEVSIEFALQETYRQLRYICYDIPATMPLVIREIFPDIPLDTITALVNDLAQKDLMEFYQTVTKDSERNIIREKYMRKILEAKLRNGDVVLAHPAHINALISQNT